MSDEGEMQEFNSQKNKETNKTSGSFSKHYGATPTFFYMIDYDRECYADYESCKNMGLKIKVKCSNLESTKIYNK